MVLISEIAELKSGTPQFRIVEDTSACAPLYFFYSQVSLEDDLRGLSTSHVPSKQIRTFDSVITTSSGDVVFSLLSGTAAMVRPERSGYLLTQNYVVLAPSQGVDPRYLVYLLNENQHIRYQLRMSQQGSVTLKYSLRQLRSLEIPSLPSQERQRCIGELYLNQMKLDALRKRASELETSLVLAEIREADQS